MASVQSHLGAHQPLSTTQLLVERSSRRDMRARDALDIAVSYGRLRALTFDQYVDPPIPMMGA
jgi:hypothetical protein